MRFSTSLKALGLLGMGLLLAAGPSQNPQTYYDHVGPILQANCVGCHTAGGVGPFPLDNPEWAVRMAPAIANSVKEGRMPPWPPGPQSPPLQGERRLNPEQVNALVAWAEQGTALGNPKPWPVETLVRPPQNNPNLRVSMPQAYTPDGSLYDDYRCFLLDPGLTQDTFVTGYRVFPGSKAMVHHVILSVVGPQAVANARQLEAQDPAPGWSCFGGSGVQDAQGGLANGLGFWVPGTDGTDFPVGTGKLLPAGSQIVMQVHYNLANGKLTDQSQIALFTAPQGSRLQVLSGGPFAAPVELVCPPGQNNPNCRRPNERTASNALNLLCGTTPAEFQRRATNPARQQTFCDRRIGQDYLVYGVTAHMHLRGVDFKLELNPGTPQAKTLLHIPRWDFQWQGQYWYQTPIAIKRGDRVRISCTFDNSGAIPGPNGQPLEPRYVTWGEGTTDEMCLGALQWVGQ